ncbi:thiol:disulfide interchange protein DsbC [Candidatus Symbiobacter mobilis CR]|uniref:Thiol:disulfide interchange protein n=2 Tax=Candidatus Symbiobacter TaxID=1436289 RepID=U5NAA9_9BURK|nr:thiol:disulfide interchange protein DsbC [Candidatus Symbiobacter mobilis CR]
MDFSGQSPYPLHCMKLLLTLTIALSLLVGSVCAQEAVLRKNLRERLPQLPPIQEVRKTPLPGLFEIRVDDADIFYTDAQGNYLFQGHWIDTRQQRDLTQERTDQLTAIRFDALPAADAITIVRGNGKRQIVIFEDPNCGYCKKFERDLLQIDNITVRLYLYPILGGASFERSKNIWCAKDRVKAWQDWMVRDLAPATATCDTSALTRNVALGRKHKITGTPTLVFADGSRIPGAVGTADIEKRLARIR